MPFGDCLARFTHKNPVQPLDIQKQLLVGRNHMNSTSAAVRSQLHCFPLVKKVAFGFSLPPSRLIDNKNGLFAVIEP